MSAVFNGLQSYRLPNNALVLLLPETEHNLVTYQVWYRVGARNESPEIFGLSHFIEHLFFKGTKTYGPGVIDRKLNEIGAMNNAATSKDYTFYYVFGLAEKFEEMFQIQTEMLLNPAFDAEEIDKERDVVIAEIHRANDNPSHIFYYQMMEQVFLNHPYAHPVLGFENIIRNVTRDQIVNYWKEHYHPENMTIVVSGNFNPEKTKELIHQSYGNLSARNDYVYQPATLKTPIPNRKLSYARTNRNYSALSFIGPDNTKHKDALALDLLGTILTDTRSSRWIKEFKEDKNLVDSISFSFYSATEQSLLTIYSLVKDNQWASYHEAIDAALERLRKYYVSKEELEVAKDYAINQSDFRWQKLTSRAQSLGFHAVMNQLDLCTRYSELISQIQLEDMVRVIEKYLSFEPVISQMLPESDKPEPSVSTSAETLAHSPKYKKSSLEENIDQFVFESGLTHIHIKQKPGGLCSVRILAGSLSELGARFPAGTINLMQNSLARGTSSLNRDTITERMDRISARYSTSQSNLNTRREYVSNSMTVPFRNFSQALDIFCSFFTDAAFVEKEVQKARESILAEIKSLPDSLSSFCLYHLMKNWFEDHPYGLGLLGTSKTVESISNKDLKDLYSLLYNPRNMIVVTAGPMSSEEANQEIQTCLNKKLGSIEFRITDQRVPSQFYPKHMGQILTVHNPKEQGYLMPAWSTCGLNHPDWHAGLVLNEMLGGGMASRYFHKMRDEKSYGYEIGARIVGYKNYGLMFAYLGTEPKRVNDASIDFKREILDIQNNIPSNEEVDKSIRLLISRHEMSLETETDRAAWVASLAIRDLKPDYIKQHAQLISSVTPAQVQAFARTWLQNSFEQRVLPKS
ncbi:MAG: insulinase family protein [Candidatus Cloacimonetes bacterium]|nr:insulinase family protein [Candidatus Cloacimonadota bacterium]